MRRAFQLLLLLLASLLLSAGVLEVGLRLFWDGYYKKYHPDHPWSEFEFHPTRGFGLGRNLELVDWDTDFKVLRKHNSRGFRSPEIPLQKPPGRLRVLMVGDSMVYGIGVENEETFSAEMERREPRLQVINAGVPAYSGAEELVQLREEIGPLDPDIVVVAYFWNDLFGAYPGRYARFELRDGELVQIPPEPASPQHPTFDTYWRRHEKRMHRFAMLAQESYLYRLVSDRLKILSYATRSWRYRWFPSAEVAEDRAEAARRAEQERAQTQEAWALSFALLEEMADVAARHGARFAILVVPDSAQVEPGANVYGLPEYVPKVQQRLIGFGEATGIPVIDPLPALRETRLREGEPQHHPNDRHWNRTGHRHVARILLDEFERLGWLDQ